MTNETVINFQIANEELSRFENIERTKLGLNNDTVINNWRDNNPTSYTKNDLSTTTLLTTGLTEVSHSLIATVVGTVGIKMQPLKTPENSALEKGKEFGNRGQCNPTYYMVGSLIEYLIDLRDNKHLSTQEIINKYAFITAGGCGPCRQGMYTTEFRKALRDSGFDGFRVIVLSRTGQTTSADSTGLNFNFATLIKIFIAIIIADILNSMQKRIRCYELENGSTKEAILKCRSIYNNAIAGKNSLLVASLKCRKILSTIKVDRTIIKPRVLVQGEFWAKTTEGAGNYNLFEFLENEGAEPVIETLSDWLLHQVWRAKWSTERREGMKIQDTGGEGIKGTNPHVYKFKLFLIDKIYRSIFYSHAKILGFGDYRLTDNDLLAENVAEHMNLHIDGGEDHMEVGHHIHTVEHKNANMTLSVKPFTCLSSSGVSDGIQSMITELYPESIVCSVETNGDASANFYGRVQMQLFKAKKSAEQDVQEAYKKYNITAQDVNAYIAKNPKINSALSIYKHEWACPAANLVAEVSRRGTFLIIKN